MPTSRREAPLGRPSTVHTVLRCSSLLTTAQILTKTLFEPQKSTALVHLLLITKLLMIRTLELELLHLSQLSRESLLRRLAKPSIVGCVLLFASGSFPPSLSRSLYALISRLAARALTLSLHCLYSWLVFYGFFNLKKFLSSSHRSFRMLSKHRADRDAVSWLKNFSRIGRYHHIYLLPHELKMA